jgi:hypothetical protein
LKPSFNSPQIKSSVSLVIGFSCINVMPPGEWFLTFLCCRTPLRFWWRLWNPLPSKMNVNTYNISCSLFHLIVNWFFSHKHSTKPTFTKNYVSCFFMQKSMANS